MKIIAFTAFMFSFNGSFSQNYSAITKEYLAIKDALVAGKQSEASVAAEKILIALKKESGNDFNAVAKKMWEEKKKMLVADSEIIFKSKSIESQRAAFSNLSPAIWELLKTSGSTEKLFYDYCPMKKNYWISAEEKIKNPYYGSQMLTCGKVSDKIN